MPDLTIPDGYAETKLIWSVVGRARPITTTLGVLPKVSHTIEETVEKMWQDLGPSFGGPCEAPNMRDVFTWEGIQYVYNDGGTLVGGATTEGPVNGSVSGVDTVIMNSSLLIRKGSAFVGRRFRGRFYWPATNLQEGQVDPMGNISIGGQTGLHILFDDVFAEWVDNDVFSPVVLHAGTGPLPSPTLITSFGIQTKLATQRRRLRS